ncbi:DNA alkylation repair protein [Ideonella sp. BN130291]|uniref:DNA alkylation repair protein n=1 Tax=Ideonella sp. BN130291 TaxID=3112940 RepID=UPI002E25C76E|nr:DNA alkylation repair protein [Ideonella sp. BN130291]
MTSATPSVDDCMAWLHSHAPTPADVQGMARFGMAVDRRIGLSIPTLRGLAKAARRDHQRALALWDTGIADAQILAAFTAEPAAFTQAQMDHWVSTMDSWDVCDQACTNAFAASPLAWQQPARWAARPEEFVRRAAFALIAALAVHDKKASDDAFVATLPLIEAAAGDERNFVRKAVNWALRQIGKRNARLHAAAVALAQSLREQTSRSARWIANDALRELNARRP